MRNLCLGSLAALILAGPVAAQCLDASVLSRGLVVTYDNGDVTVIRRTSGGYQTVDERYASGDPDFRFRAHRGIYFVEEFEPDAQGRPVPGTGLVVEFPIDPADLPDPAPGARWEGRTVNLFDDGGSREEVTTFSFVEAPDVTLSGCTYALLRADVRYDWGEEGWLELQYAYLTDIGTAILMSSRFEGEDPATYVPVSLERLRK